MLTPYQFPMPVNSILSNPPSCLHYACSQPLVVHPNTSKNTGLCPPHILPATAPHHPEHRVRPRALLVHLGLPKVAVPLPSLQQLHHLQQQCGGAPVFMSTDPSCLARQESRPALAPYPFSAARMTAPACNSHKCCPALQPTSPSLPKLSPPHNQEGTWARFSSESYVYILSVECTIQPTHLLRRGHDVLPQPRHIHPVLLVLVHLQLGVLWRQQVVDVFVVQLRGGRGGGRGKESLSWVFCYLTDVEEARATLACA